jgi:hypothetical protein
MAKKVYFYHPYWDERLITSEDFESVGLKDEPELRIKPNGVAVEVSDAVYDYLMANERYFQDHAPTKEQMSVPVLVPPEGDLTVPANKARAEKRKKEE